MRRWRPARGGPHEDRPRAVPAPSQTRWGGRRNRAVFQVGPKSRRSGKRQPGSAWGHHPRLLHRKGPEPRRRRGQLLRGGDDAEREGRQGRHGGPGVVPRGLPRGADGRGGRASREEAEAQRPAGDEEPRERVQEAPDAGHQDRPEDRAGGLAGQVPHGRAARQRGGRRDQLELRGLPPRGFRRQAAQPQVHGPPVGPRHRGRQEGRQEGRARDAAAHVGRRDDDALSRCPPGAAQPRRGCPQRRAGAFRGYGDLPLRGRVPADLLGRGLQVFASPAEVDRQFCGARVRLW
mmetsp:Transcript_38534/g.110268  ORF Transcript_38534/g.110268 Transcript_38534/m.110268 type:complete len:291 (+) Transcript_38534:470-1342(+)